MHSSWPTLKLKKRALIAINIGNVQEKSAVSRCALVDVQEHPIGLLEDSVQRPVDLLQEGGNLMAEKEMNAPPK